MNILDENIYYLIPKQNLDELIEAVRDLKRIHDMNNGDIPQDILGDFICEEEAMKILQRGKTWFYNKRKSGDLPGKKAAGRWYYKKKDITNYIKDA